MSFRDEQRGFDVFLLRDSLMQVKENHVQTHRSSNFPKQLFLLLLLKCLITHFLREYEVLQDLNLFKSQNILNSVTQDFKKGKRHQEMFPWLINITDIST